MSPFETTTIGPGADQEESDRIVGALLYLMAQLPERGGSPELMLAVGRHLELLAMHPAATAGLRRAALRLRNQWLRRLANGCGTVSGGSLH